MREIHFYSSHPFIVLSYRSLSLFKVIMTGRKKYLYEVFVSRTRGMGVREQRKDGNIYGRFIELKPNKKLRIEKSVKTRKQPT